MNLNAKVLLLDDEPLVQMILRARLENAGALVVEARCCAEALSLARNTDFDAGVFDHRLPDGSGLDVVKTLDEEGLAFPVILLSGDAADLVGEVEDCEHILAVQAKPPNPKAVVEKLAALMGCPVEREATRVGRYAFWKAVAGEEIPVECIRDEWLAIDMTRVDDFDLHASVLEALARTRSGTAVIGADDAVRQRISAMRIDIDFVKDAEELAALSRHPASPSERNAVLSAVTGIST